MTNETSKVLTLVFTDLADSTALKREHGDQAVGDLIARHREYVTRIADESAGRVIDWAGDGCFLTFDTSSAGVMFALRLQQAHADDDDMPGVRIGLHMGEVTEKTGPLGPDGPPRIEGLAVDLAARIQGLAKPGQVLMSSAVYQSARQRLGVETFGAPILWQAHGDYSIKGFDDALNICEAGLEGMSPLEAPGASEKAQPLVPVATPNVEVMPPDKPATVQKYAFIAMFFAAIIGVTLGADYIAGLMTKNNETVPSSEAGSIDTLAVLPFDNYSGDEEQEFFVDGMTDLLTAELSKLSSLTVKARTSAMRYKDTDMSLSEIARELDVQVLVEGSVFRSGNEVRITAQLVRGDTEEHLWGDNYTGKLADALQLQSDVALDIVEQIHAAITPGERDRIGKIQTENPAALDEYLRGRYFWNKRTPEGLEKAIEHFELATVLDPNYAEAYAGLAETYVLLPAYSNVATPLALEKVRAMAKRALELDETLAPPHAALGLALHLYEWNWAAAEASLRRAIELDPNHPTSHHWYANFLSAMGRHEESVREIQSALRLDPVSLITNVQAGFMLKAARQYDRAIAQLNSALEMDPDFRNSLFHQSLAYLETGRLADARITVERLIRVTKDSDKEALNLEVLGLLQVREGDRVGAETTVAMLMKIASEREKLGDSARGTGTELGALSAVTIALGQIDTGFEWLERAFENRYWSLPSNLVTPRYDPVRSDPRFHSLLRRMNYPEDAIERLTEPLDSADAPIEKIAVLPFDNLMGDPEQEYFVDGMTETLIAQLAKIDGMRVISRTSAMRYKGSDESLPVIARELGVDALVEGSVMRAGNDVRITAQLIHGVTDEHLWANSYDGTLDNILSLQSEVALAIANEIQVAVSPEKAQRLLQQESVDPEAQEAYLKGRYHFHKATRSDYATSIEYFMRAIELDPDFARAYSGLASAYIDSAAWGFAPSAETLAKSNEATLKAIALDETLAQPHDALSWIAFVLEWDWEKAEREFRRSLELDPHDAFLRYNPTWQLSYFGRHEEAIAMIEKGLELDPLMLILHWTAGMAYNHARQPEKAIQIAEQALQLDPDFGPAHIELGVAYVQMGEYAKAVGILTSATELTEDSVYAIRWLAQAHVGAGNLDEARRLLREAMGNPNVETVYPALIASMHASLGNNDKAFEYLERAYEVRDWWMIGIRDDPIWDSIRDDPRFQPFVDKLNLPPLPDNR